MSVCVIPCLLDSEERQLQLFQLAVITDWRSTHCSHLVDVVGGVLLDVAHPVSDVVEGRLVRDIVHKQDPHGSSVVSCTGRAATGLLGSDTDQEETFLLQVIGAAIFRQGAELTAGDGPEPLLACCVPYLKLDPLIVNEDFLYLEVNPARQDYFIVCFLMPSEQGRQSQCVCWGIPNSGYEAGSEGVLREAQQQTALTNTCAGKWVKAAMLRARAGAGPRGKPETPGESHSQLKCELHKAGKAAYQSHR